MVDNATVVESTPVASTPPRRHNVDSNAYTIDITTRFQNAASRIIAGTLIKEEHFTLFESVGALEIGDPKMDSGCIEDGESLDIDFDVCKPLLPAEMVWMMDELLSREVAWHMGYPLSQTLFTSVYIDKLLWPSPLRLSDVQFSKEPAIQNADPMLHQLFRSYCLGLLKSCDLVLNMVTSQHYYEEEDFAPYLFNREMLRKFQVEEILADMGDALRYLQNTTLEASLKESFEARMRFRIGLLSLLSTHTMASLSSQSVTTVDNSLLTSIRASRNIGIPVPESFTLKIQRRLASSVPPRPMVTIDESRTFDYLTRFVHDSEQAFSVLCTSHSQDLLMSYWMLCSQDPQPSVYVRALLQSWLNREDLVGGFANEFDFILNDMLSLTMAASPVTQALYSSSDLATSDHSLAARHLREFIAKNGRSFLNLWRTTCLNRCRVRRTLCHAAVEWDQIQVEAEELDDELQRLINERAITYPLGAVPTYSYSLSSWVYHHKLIQLRLIVQLGFELDVYAPHELASMYWYLGHLCDAHLGHLERIGFFISQRESALSPASRRSDSGRRVAEESGMCLQNLYRQFSWLKATESTARALHGLYTVLQRHNHLQQPTTTYASDKLRYELRMRPFQCLSIPEPLSFEQCRRRSRVEVRNDLEVLEEAASHVATARRGWEEVLRGQWHAFPLREDADERSASVIDNLWRTDIGGAARATIGVSIAVGALQDHVRKGSSRESGRAAVTIPRIGDRDRWHAWWLVPRLSL